MVTGNVLLLIIAGLLIILSQLCSAGEEESVKGFHGKITDKKEHPAGLPSPLEGDLGADVSISDMAMDAMNYLTRNPLQKHDCLCRFNIHPSAYPLSITDGEDVVAYGDTEIRMLRAFNFMRDISGSKEGTDTEAAIRNRVLSYISSDGLSYCTDCNTCLPELLVLNWAMSNTLSYLMERYHSTKDSKDLLLAVKLVDGLKKLADWDTGRAYYEGGLGGWKDGKWTMTGCKDAYPCVLESIVQYYDITKDKEVLEFANAFAEGLIAGLQSNLSENAIKEDGSFGGYNSHLHMRMVLGVVHLGVVTGNTRYIEWGRKVYNFLVTHGGEWGWFMEGPPPTGGYGGEQYAERSETCVVGDMAETAMWLAKAGYTVCWDDIDRYVRNYLAEAQFFVTPEYKALYNEWHKDNPDNVADGLKQAEDFEGGFIARLTPNAMVYAGSNINMMGCCPPEGMRSLHVAWRSAVTRTGRKVFVNLAFNRETPDAEIKASSPDKGTLTVVVKKSGDYYLRPPSWVDRSKVKAFTGGKEIPAVWSGDYIRFEKASKGEELKINYPVITFKQTIDIALGTYTYTWCGNKVVDVSPKSTNLPLFSGKTMRTSKYQTSSK